MLSKRDVVGIGALNIAKSDSTTYDPPLRRIYVGGTGNVNVKTASGDNVLYTAVPTGSYIYPMAVKVYSTNTNATAMVGEN